jgi:hypothetical protein
MLAARELEMIVQGEAFLGATGGEGWARQKQGIEIKNERRLKQKPLSRMSSSRGQSA